MYSTYTVHNTVQGNLKSWKDFGIFLESEGDKFE